MSSRGSESANANDAFFGVYMRHHLTQKNDNREQLREREDRTRKETPPRRGRGCLKKRKTKRYQPYSSSSSSRESSREKEVRIEDEMGWIGHDNDMVWMSNMESSLVVVEDAWLIEEGERLFQVYINTDACIQ